MIWRWMYEFIWLIHCTKFMFFKQDLGHQIVFSSSIGSWYPHSTGVYISQDIHIIPPFLREFPLSPSFLLFFFSLPFPHVNPSLFQPFSSFFGGLSIIFFSPTIKNSYSWPSPFFLGGGYYKYTPLGIHEDFKAIATGTS